MKKFNKITPEGTKDILFEECLSQRTVSERLTHIFKMRGYNEVITPGMEYYDVFDAPNAAIPQYEMYKSTDNKCRLIVFSPDLLCSTANDIIRVKYIQPVLDGELTVPRLIRAGTNLHESVSAAFQTAYTMLENRPPFFEFPVKAAMLSAFGALVQNGVSARISASKRAAADSIKAAIAFIQENYRSAVSVQQLAHAAGMSEGHFCRVFKQYTLKTPVQFINGVRLSHALELLTATNLRVLDIAMDCGFNSMSYFIEVFRTEYDATPLQYRKKLEEIKVPK